MSKDKKEEEKLIGKLYAPVKGTADVVIPDTPAAPAARVADGVADAAAQVIKTTADVAREDLLADAKEAREDRRQEREFVSTERKFELLKQIALAFFIMIPPTVTAGVAAWQISAANHQLIEVRRVGQETHQLGQETHELVNSASLAQLKLNAELSHWKAKQTGDPADIAAAAAADKLIAEHIEKQKRADATKGRQRP